MRILVDNALSWRVAEALRTYGYDALHVRDMGLRDADDTVIFARAMSDDRIIISADTDFGSLLALREYTKPSFVLWRAGDRHPLEQALTLRRVLIAMEEELTTGAVVVVEGQRVRVRPLPVKR